ncbi:DUF4168 domain-containing protein [Thermosynechococcaceae cyanobacterium BACA0444]|uniref:DUF4168 domain-containing protein n=1 Tax=Pseudocalidococcus azoricus BACA0444 TaxID=2918990 RepID=A0AAE4FRX3_9CYAN|nr:DUF4168 domain-containing protein [Pseudocalidococcus azoricus]MDS3861139.1 DUF4168 domain-containing protein [Pseudocalidococcus azoricus BACA0444]
MNKICAYGQALARWGLGLLIVLGLVIGGLSNFSGPAWAATTPETPELTASDISAEKISQFAQAYRQVIALIDSREAELRSAETQAEALQIEQDIETAAITQIEAAGLTGPEYLQLLGLANTYPELSQRIVTQLQESD